MFDKKKKYKAPVRVRRIVDGKDTVTDEITYLRVKKIMGLRNSRNSKGESIRLRKVFLEDGTTREYVESFLIECNDKT